MHIDTATESKLPAEPPRSAAAPDVAARAALSPQQAQERRAGRIWFINRYYRPDHSATAQILTDVAEGLAARGLDVHVIASRQRIDHPGAALPSRERLDGVSVRRVKAPYFGRGRLIGRAIDYLGFYLGAAWHVLRHVRRHDIVVTKTDPPMLGVVLAPLARLRGARTINWLQDVYPEVAHELGLLVRATPLWRLLARLRDRNLRRTDRNVVIGVDMQAYLGRRGVPGSKLVYIPNFAPGLQHTPVPDPDNPLRRQLGLCGEDVLVVYSGNLGRAHPLEGWLEAAYHLAGDPHLHFLVIGDGAGRPLLEEVMGKRVGVTWHFLPYQPRERLAESLGAADVHLVLLDPRLEGMILPSKLYGVLASARPCLYFGSSRGEIAALLQRYQCGAAVDAADGRSAAELLRHWAADRPLRERMGRNARAAYEAAFTPERVTEAWATLLHELKPG